MKIVTALLLALASGAVLADCKPVVGSFEARVVPPGTGHCPATAPFCTAGRVWGGIQGTYQFVMTNSESSVLLGGLPTIFFFAGRSTVTLKSGDIVRGTDTGSIAFAPGGFASLSTFDGGGQARLRGDFDASQGTTSGDYLGSLCTP